MMKAKLEALVEEMIEGGIRLEDAVAAFEKAFITKALERHQGHLSKTAKFLGIHRNTLSSRVQSYKKVRAATARR
jgi:DNA-binding NtrC family response regulator